MWGAVDSGMTDLPTLCEPNASSNSTNGNGTTTTDLLDLSNNSDLSRAACISVDTDTASVKRGNGRMTGEDRKMRPEELDAHRRLLLVHTSATTNLPQKATAKSKNQEELSFVIAFLLHLKAEQSPVHQKRHAVVKTQEKRERKRKINRLSAQRKRIRERDLLETLSEHFKELTATKDQLLKEASELRNLLADVKARKANGTSTVSAASATTCATSPEQRQDTIPPQHRESSHLGLGVAAAGRRVPSPLQALFHLQNRGHALNHQNAPLDPLQWQALMALASQTAAASALFPSAASATTIDPMSMELLRMNGLPPPLSHSTTPQNAAFRTRHESFGSGLVGDSLSALPANLALLNERGWIHEAAPFSSSNHHLSSLLNHSSMPHGLSTSIANPLQTYWTQSHHGARFPIMHNTEPHFSPPMDMNVESVHNPPAVQQQLLVALLQSAAAVQHGLGDLQQPPLNPAATTRTNATESLQSGTATESLEAPLAANAATASRRPTVSSLPTDQFSCLMAAIAQQMPPAHTETEDS
jgi:hypothetical protein